MDEKQENIHRKAAITIVLCFCLPMLIASHTVFFIGTEVRPSLSHLFLFLFFSALILVCLFYFPFSFTVQIFKFKPLAILANIGSKIEGFILSKSSYVLSFAILATILVILCISNPLSYSYYVIVRQCFIIPYMGLSIFLRGLDEDDALIFSDVLEYRKLLERTKDSECDMQRAKKMEIISKHDYRLFLAHFFFCVMILLQGGAFYYCDCIHEKYSLIIQIYEDYTQNISFLQETDDLTRKEVNRLKESADAINFLVKKRIKITTYSYYLICLALGLKDDALNTMCSIHKGLVMLLSK